MDIDSNNNEEEKATARKLFDALDMNCDGVLTHEEFVTAMQQLDPTQSPSVLLQLYRKLDTNGQRAISFEEFFNNCHILLALNSQDEKANYEPEQNEQNDQEEEQCEQDQQPVRRERHAEAKMSELQEEKDSLYRQLTQAEETVAELQFHNQDLQRQLHVILQKSDRMHKATEQVEKDNTEQFDRIQELEKEVSTLSRDIESIRVKYKKEIDANITLKDRERVLQIEIEQLQLNNRKMIQQTQDLQKRGDEYSKVVIDLQNEISELQTTEKSHQIKEKLVRISSLIATQAQKSKLINNSERLKVSEARITELEEKISLLETEKEEHLRVLKAHERPRRLAADEETQSLQLVRSTSLGAQLQMSEPDPEAQKKIEELERKLKEVQLKLTKEIENVRRLEQTNSAIMQQINDGEKVRQNDQLKIFKLETEIRDLKRKLKTNGHDEKAHIKSFSSFNLKQRAESMIDDSTKRKGNSKKFRTLFINNINLLQQLQGKRATLQNMYGTLKNEMQDVKSQNERFQARIKRTETTTSPRSPSNTLSPSSQSPPNSPQSIASHISGVSLIPEKPPSLFTLISNIIYYWILYLILIPLEIYLNVIECALHLPGRIYNYSVSVPRRAYRYSLAVPGRVYRYGINAPGRMYRYASDVPGRVKQYAVETPGRVKQYAVETPSRVKEYAISAITAPKRMGSYAVNLVATPWNWIKRNKENSMNKKIK